MFVPQLHVRWPLIGAAAFSLFLFEAKPAVPATPPVPPLPPPFGAGSSSPRKVVPRGRPTLTGIVSVRDTTAALVELGPSSRDIRFLRIGERDGEYEILSISPQTAKVVVRDVSNNEEFELTLPEPAPTRPQPFWMQFRNATLLNIFDIYQDLSMRTVIRPSAIPISRPLPLRRDQSLKQPNNSKLPSTARTWLFSIGPISSASSLPPLGPWFWTQFPIHLRRPHQIRLEATSSFFRASSSFRRLT
jgi:hypothetical protein